MGRQSTLQKKNDKGTRMTWNEDDDISGELLTQTRLKGRSRGPVRRHDLKDGVVCVVRSV